MTPDEETNCKTCVNNIVPSDIVVCDTLGDTVCGAIYQRCQCGPCVSEIESYLACAFEEKDGCSFDCASSLTEAPTVSPTPKPTEAATFAPTVAATVAQTKSPTTSPTVSPTASPTVSPTLAPTTKSPTKSPTVSPTTKSPTLPPTPSPTSKQCNNEQINYQGCFDSFLTSDDQETCMSCIQESLPPANSDCGDVEYSSCVATQQCQACGVCKRYVGAYVSCFYEVEFGCTIDCANVEYPTPTPFPTAAPTTLPATAAPTSGQVCPEEFEAYKGCFADTMTEEQEEECKACVNSALPDGRFECEVLRDSACQAVYSICNCGSCQPEIAGFLRCAYKENTGCSMDCSGVLTVGVDPSEYRTCSLERSSFMGCYASQLNVEESAACSSCASGWMFPITTQSLSEAGDYCDEMQARICSSLETCDCGVCSDSLAALQECELEEQAASCPDIDCESFQEEAGSTDVPLPESDTANPNTPTAPTMGSSSSEGVLNRVQAAVLLLLSSSLLLTS